MRPTSEAPNTRATPGAERTLRTMARPAACAAPGRLRKGFVSGRILPRRLSATVIRYRFGADDLLRTRFAVSPLFEVVWSTHVLRDPTPRSLHRPWVGAARARLAGLDWSLLDLVANGP